MTSVSSTTKYVRSEGSRSRRFVFAFSKTRTYTVLSFVILQGVKEVSIRKWLPRI